MSLFHSFLCPKGWLNHIYCVGTLQIRPSDSSTHRAGHYESVTMDTPPLPVCVCVRARWYHLPPGWHYFNGGQDAQLTKSVLNGTDTSCANCIRKSGKLHKSNSSVNDRRSLRGLSVLYIQVFRLKYINRDYFCIYLSTLRQSLWVVYRYGNTGHSLSASVQLFVDCISWSDHLLNEMKPGFLLQQNHYISLWECTSF